MAQLSGLACRGAWARVVPVDSRPVAFGANGVWVLEEDRQRWARTEWRPDGEVLGAASDGRIAFVLLGAGRDGPVERIEKMTLARGVPATSAFPALPAPLFHALAHEALLVFSVKIACLIPPSRG